MATSTSKISCVKCDKNRASFKCAGCLQEYCFDHLKYHREELNKQLDEVEINRDIFRQSFNQQIEQFNNHLLTQKIDEWENNSIKIIQKTAQEAREILLKTIKEYNQLIETKLHKLTNEIREIRQENDFNEINLRSFEEELKLLNEELAKQSHISIHKESTPLIHKISVDVSKSSIFQSRWVQNALTVAGGNEEGNKLNQLSSPYGMFVDDNQTIYVADCENHRIVEWKYGVTNGQVIAGGNGSGPHMNQLKCPTNVIVDKETNNLIICDHFNFRVVRWPHQNGANGQIIIPDIACWGLAMDNDGHLYVSEHWKHAVGRWGKNYVHKKLVAGGNGQGNRLDQLDYPSYIFVDEDHSVYVSDYDNDRVMKWMKDATEGFIVAGGHGRGNGLTQLSCPQGVIVDHSGTVYVADSNNHRVMGWPKGATQGYLVVGGHGVGNKPNQLNYPFGLSFDRQGNLYVVDKDNHRIQRFDIDQNYNST